jgi:hypothetical protein
VSLLVDRREELGDQPGVHALVCGVGDYPAARSSRLADELELEWTSQAARSAGAVGAWFAEHSEELALPLVSCRVLGTDEAQPPTLHDFLAAAADWRADAARHRDGMTICYLAGLGYPESKDSYVVLLGDFGDRVGGLLHNAISDSSLIMGMAPDPSQPDMAGKQLYFVDAERVPPSSFAQLERSYATQVFDIGIADREQRRAVATYRALEPARDSSAARPLSRFAERLLDALGGRAATLLPDGGWGVTTHGLGNALRPDEPSQSVVFGIFGEDTVLTRPRAIERVPVEIVVEGLLPVAARVVVRDEHLSEVLTAEVHEQAVRLELAPGFYAAEVEGEQETLGRTLLLVAPPSVRAVVQAR